MEQWLTRLELGRLTAAVASVRQLKCHPCLLVAYTLDVLVTDISGELLESVHSAGACLMDIRELAGKLVPLSAEQIESLLLKFVDGGEDRAVSRLLQACAFNGVKLDPTILCRCVGVCEDILDTAPLFRTARREGRPTAVSHERCRGIACGAEDLRYPPGGRANRQVRSGPAAGAKGTLEARTECAAA